MSVPGVSLQQRRCCPCGFGPVAKNTLNLSAAAALEKRSAKNKGLGPLVMLFVLCVNGTDAVAQKTTPVFSGPQPGERLPALKVILAYGKEAGRTVDLRGRGYVRAAGRTRR